MIKTYKSYLINEGGIITSYIVGMPSGEVIDVNSDELARLKEEHLIKYNQKLKYFTFRDGNYKNIKKALQKKMNIQYIHHYMEHFGIERYKINADHSVDVYGNVDISMKNLTKIPFKFGKVTGNFDCIANKLTTLVNSPDEIHGYFDCSSNDIYTLIGGPKYVSGGYYCMDNNLEDLEGYPKTCLVIFNCSRNNLKSLKGSPRVIEAKSFDVSHNNLKTLSEGPKITKSFDCSYNQISTLSKGIIEVNGTFNCTYNKLTSLMGWPTCDRILYREGNKIEEIDYD